jgi:hypothetical protein
MFLLLRMHLIDLINKKNHLNKYLSGFKIIQQHDVYFI